MELNLVGPFRSGTNWLQALLELNHDVRLVPAAGFKHHPVPASAHGPVVGVLKDPLAWLVSMWRYVNDVGARHTRCGATWDDFLVTPLEVFHGGIEGFPHQRFATPVDYWNAMGANLLSLPGQRCRVVRYEDLLADPAAVIGGIADHFGLPRRTDDFQHVTRRTRNLAPGALPRSAEHYTHDTVFDPTPYLAGGHLDAFTRRQRRTVRRQLDTQVLAGVGYDD